MSTLPQKIQNGNDAPAEQLNTPALTDPISADSTPLFVEYLRRGAKPVDDWRCGVEFEVFGYDMETLERLDAAQVQTVLAGFAASPDDLIYEGHTIVEASAAGGVGRVTVEPGGQVEFSGAPQRTLAGVERELKRYLARLREIGESNGFIFLATGFDPLRTIGEQRWFPKARYAVMRPYLATRGRRAWDMMCRTAAIQANFDYDSEDDLAKKFILGNRLAPILTAIFANSPFEDGKLSGYKSTRAATWLETDDDRAGLAPPALTDDFSLAAFVEYVRSVPMLFARREERYLDAPTGMCFGEFLDRGCGDISPVFGDWVDHLTTIFTDARLKQHIELRNADSGSLSMALALQALWKGLIYDREALDEALRVAPSLNSTDAVSLREAVARDGLAAHVVGVNVLGLAKEIVALAASGLERIALGEARYLDVLRAQVIEDEVCPADLLLRNWHGSIKNVIEHVRVT